VCRISEEVQLQTGINRPPVGKQKPACAWYDQRTPANIRFMARRLQSLLRSFDGNRAGLFTENALSQYSRSAFSDLKATEKFRALRPNARSSGAYENIVSYCTRRDRFFASSDSDSYKGVQFQGPSGVHAACETQDDCIYTARQAERPKSLRQVRKI
jgi:hypothetical protein